MTGANKKTNRRKLSNNTNVRLGKHAAGTTWATSLDTTISFSPGSFVRVSVLLIAIRKEEVLSINRKFSVVDLQTS